ncbi:isopentenyl-diphosphate delta-isomerase [Pedobacter sp. UYP30]|uniref:isopentenyl-diphosphate Delta-isomerase n=1 Tax=Pedobacter sp. UYP30 TaxID=1756400 RepID=UPI00339AFDDE
MNQQIILVDENDCEIGEMEKMAVHESGVLHRAFSVFIFNSENQLLLQRRAFDKYHCGGLWTNTCCSHPGVGEDNALAADRRLMEEMGIFCKLEHKFFFKYYASFENGLKEHEIDHVFFGFTNQIPILNLEEAADYRYLSLEELSLDIDEKPALYTPWLKICLSKVIEFKNLVK